MTTLDVTYPSWMDGAACPTSDADFFPTPGRSPRPAKAVCRTCPVQLACLSWAVAEHIGHGVYGGLTAQERERLGPRAFPCPDCGQMLRSETGLPIHRQRWCSA